MKLLDFTVAGSLLLLVGCFSGPPPKPTPEPETTVEVTPEPSSQPEEIIPEPEPSPPPVEPQPQIAPPPEAPQVQAEPPVAALPPEPAAPVQVAVRGVTTTTATTDLPLGIIGESEVIHLPDFSAPFEARIDTGATTSSIEAVDVKTFERDGRKWVRFRITTRSGDEGKNYELPVARTVRIKQHNSEALERISVMLTFRMGHLTLEREFTLAERGHFNYPVLIGRNIISGLAAVDPSRRNVL